MKTVFFTILLATTCLAMDQMWDWTRLNDIEIPLEGHYQAFIEIAPEEHVTGLTIEFIVEMKWPSPDRTIKLWTLPTSTLPDLTTTPTKSFGTTSTEGSVLVLNASPNCTVGSSCRVYFTFTAEATTAILFNDITTDITLKLRAGTYLRGVEAGKNYPVLHKNVWSAEEKYDGTTMQYWSYYNPTATELSLRVDATTWSGAIYASRSSIMPNNTNLEWVQHQEVLSQNWAAGNWTLGVDGDSTITVLKTYSLCIGECSAAPSLILASWALLAGLLASLF